MEKLFRERVLDMSLTIEDMLSTVLFMLFRFSKEESRTLSHKSSALSLKNKTDLLHDLNRISDETYKYLLVFMEIRNQFIHNLSCSNIIIAAERIGKLKYLISLSDEAKRAYERSLPEDIKIIALELSFMKVYGQILDALSQFSESFQRELDEELEEKVSKELLQTMNELLEIYSDSVDFVSDKFDEVFGGEFSNENRVRLKDLIFNRFVQEIEKYKERKNLNDVKTG